MIRGVWQTVGAYVAWGLLPVHWTPLGPVPALQLIGRRILWSFLALLLLIAVRLHVTSARAVVRFGEQAVVDVTAVAGYYTVLSMVTNAARDRGAGTDFLSRMTMRKIDIFTHIFPEPYVTRMQQVAPGWKDIGKRVRGIPMLVDLDVRFRVMDQHEGYQQILSIATPPIEAYASGAEALDLARRANDGMAALVAKYPDRFPGFVASLPMGEPDAAVEETDRAMRQLGARGIQVFTNVKGKPLTAPEFLPLFEVMAGYDLPIWLHPFRDASFPDYQSETRSLYEIWWTFGWPYETSVAMARIVFAGLFDRFPHLKIITHHMGAMAPYFEGRVGPGWDQLGARTSDEDYTVLLKALKKRPIDYFRMFYADTALFGAYDGTVCGLAFFGVDKVLFASDAPFDPEKGSMYIRETVALVDRLPITPGDRERIYWRNTAQLLKLS